MTPSFPASLWNTLHRSAAIPLGVLLIALFSASCSTDRAASLFSSSCDDIGSKPANAPESTPTEVIVLLDVSNNDESSAERIATDVGAVLDHMLSSSDDILLTGMASGGTEASISRISCMDGSEYFFAGGNERRQESERSSLKDHLITEMQTAIQSTQVAETGDARVLLRQVPLVAKYPTPRVILYSSFLSQGSDCLTFDQGESPSAELAASVANRCAEQGLLPSLGDAEMTVVGAGSTPDRPELSAFGQSLASELCSRMAQTCDIR